MRVVIPEKNLKELFEIIKNKKISAINIADKLTVSTKTINDWKGSKFIIPLASFKKLKN